MITAGWETLADRANALAHALREAATDCAIEVTEEFGQVGGGSVPGQMLKTFAVSLAPTHISVAELDNRLRHTEPPIIARISKDRLLLDVRTIEAADDAVVVSAIAQALRG